MNIPQVIKSEHNSQGRQPVFAYKRNAAMIAWPMAVKKQQSCQLDTPPEILVVKRKYVIFVLMFHKFSFFWYFNQFIERSFYKRNLSLSYCYIDCKISVQVSYDFILTYVVRILKIFYFFCQYRHKNEVFSIVLSYI